MADNVTIKDANNANVVTGTDEVTIGGVLQQVQRVKLIDGSDGGVSPITAHPAGFMRVSDEPTQLFYDPFDTTLETTNLWTTPTVGNSAVLATNTGGVMTLGTGTTINGWSKLFSLPTFRPTVPSWLGYSFANRLTDGAAPTANAYRFWGAGTPATTPTTAAPMTDAVGFEVTTAGKLQCVVYAAGVRTLVADLSSTGTNTQPLDANWHRYIIYVRTDRIYFYIDGLAAANLVATADFTSPAVQTLPIAFLAVGGATAPATNTTIQSAGAAVWDTGKNNQTISDATHPFRKVSVGRTGGLSIKGSSITGSSTNIPVSTPTNTAATDVSEAGNVTFIIKNTVAANAFAGNPVIVLEQSDDATSWAPLLAVHSGTGQVASTFTLTPNTANTEVMIDASVEGVNWVRARVTTGPTTNAMTVVISGGGMPFTPVVATIDGEVRPTYRATTAAVLVPAVTVNLPWFIISGAATKTVKVQRIIISGLTLTAVAYLNVGCAKYSTAPGGGTATALTKVPLDSLSPSSVALLVQTYTAGPTAGTKVGDLSARRNLGQATTAAAAGIPENIEFDFRSSTGNHPPVLRGTAENLGLYWITAPATTVSMLLTVEWTEEG